MDPIQAMGAYATISIEQIGSYAGFAAVLGLAVLAALYFSQARDVKRLREWAGRAPERDAEARARVAAATPDRQARQGAPAATPTPAAQPANSGAAAPAVQPANSGAAAPAAKPGTAQPATAEPATANSGGNSSGTATPAKAPALTAAAAATGAKPAATSGPPVPGMPRTGGPPPVGGRPSSGATSILGPRDEPRQPWYRRLAPRYIALIVAGVLVVGGGIAVGAVQLLSGADSTGASSSGGGAADTDLPTGAETPKRTPIRPGDVSVAVLNATAVPGLAKQFGDQAQAAGFKRDNVGNAPGGEQRAESVVLYAPGKQREARLVARKFDVSNIEPVDAPSRGLAPQADVVLVIGANKTP